MIDTRESPWCYDPCQSQDSRRFQARVSGGPALCSPPTPANPFVARSARLSFSRRALPPSFVGVVPSAPRVSLLAGPRDRIWTWTKGPPIHYPLEGQTVQQALLFFEASILPSRSGLNYKYGPFFPIFDLPFFFNIYIVVNGPFCLRSFARPKRGPLAVDTGPF
jgi:hypothetical protein